jgi:spectinomycin phosphotransferase
MLEKPDLADEMLVACLREHYGLSVTGVEFLPLGNDSSAWVYRLFAEAGVYFLKVKKGAVNPASLLVPRYLKDSGIEQIVAPLPTVARRLWCEAGAFSAILYPFVNGTDGMTLGLSEAQWVEYGAVLRRIHSTQLPSELLPHARREAFTPKWRETLNEIVRRMERNDFTHPSERELAAFWQAHQAAIWTIITRADELGRRLQSQSLKFVLCHADIHTANILLDSDGKLFVVDWDEVLLAPKERDLMFVVGGAAETDAEALFFKGYGVAAIDRLALAYYRYEWVVQELGDYGGRVLLTHDGGAETRRHAVRSFRELFQPGDVVEAAYESDRRLTGAAS